ncbi:hypothetical protein Pst134EA_009688 [Puccinia striiformis f. sp. tritici]|uniref:Exonuclease domain-containing protein n=1 Tax=Puccinia striiformis f. sp. tritici PST-78 TaxID=1165861 RepID=A0A0L0V6G7_9BASI|nr:hypothetical protein Pst134EA_009688 [Puccinia striiformis f. sp. tritici]KAH9469159.1 hypothetical protein Pst134EA_009688 [Puccinia striiformis f. sp. tritici]KNE94863.1 hypothetical protein, variant [Puccinia striiformis f. sp. tritici PST-78]
MTGLDVTVDQIIEIACIITDKDLQELDDGIQFVIHVEQSVLDRMGPWCQNQHGKSGLSESCLQSSHTLTEVDQKIRNYLEHHLPGLKGKAVLAGNSVYADKMFLNKDLPLVAQYLHYRLVDVSSIKELARRWEPKLVELAKPASIPSKHRALDDIRDSISGVLCRTLKL